MFFKNSKMKIADLFLKKFIFTPLLEKTQEMPKVFVLINLF
jgi:hypothetical protein